MSNATLTIRLKALCEPFETFSKLLESVHLRVVDLILAFSIEPRNKTLVNTNSFSMDF
jgi:hypothetical protein